jgi:tetratricopeptide (TPR) repeat protein
MLRRCLVGPVSKRFADRHLLPFRQAGECVAFGPDGPDLEVGWNDSWSDVCRRLPSGWQPDALVLCLAYARIPPGLMAAPVPIIGYARDWPILWHALRRQAAGCDVLWTDPVGVRRLAAAGYSRGRAVLPFGDVPDPEGEPADEGRDLDVLFAGNLQPAIHRDRLPWVARVARLRDRWNVRIHQDVDADRCRPLLRRARIVFQHSFHGTWDALTPTVLATGALLFREAGEAPLPGLVAGRDHVAYTARDLEQLLQHYLEDERARRAVAAAGRARAAEFQTAQLWPRALATLDAEWEEWTARARHRAGLSPPSWDRLPVLSADQKTGLESCPTKVELVTRVWQVLGSASRPDDAGLVKTLRDAVAQAPDWAEGCHILGLLHGSGPTPDLEETVAWCGRAWSGPMRHPVAGLHLVEALTRLGRHTEAVATARELLAVLEQTSALPAELRDAAPAPPGFDVLRVEWERVAWENAGQPDAEAAGKRDLLLYRLRLLLARLTGEEEHHREARRLRPDLFAAHARRSRVQGQEPRSGNRVSLCMIVRNEEQNLGRCLDSVRDLVGELVVVDTGSTDRTREVAAARGARVVSFAWCDDFAAARNAGVDHATGDWVFWLDADEYLDAANRGRLAALLGGLRDENAAYLMRQLSRPSDALGAVTAVDQVRLFRNRPDIRWEYRIHEQILLAVRRARADLRPTDVVIEHFGYQDPAVRQGKLERNLRLLELAHRERPEDPILAFNLAWALYKTGRPGEALPLLELCRDRLPPEVSIVPKVYRLLGQLHQQAGRREQALVAFRTGRALFPEDVELLLHEGLLLRQLRDHAGAEACLRRILVLPAASCLGGLDLRLRGYKTRHALAELYLEQRRHGEAEAEWQAVVAEEPGFAPAWVGLGEVHLARGEWAAVERVLARLHGTDAERLRERLSAAARDGQSNRSQVMHPPG